MGDDRSVERLIDTLKEPVRLDPGLDDRIMAAVERLPAHSQRASRARSLAFIARSPGRSARSVMVWLRRRSIRLSPLGAAGLAAVVATVVLMGNAVARRGVAPDLPQSAEVSEQPQMTQFVFVAPTAQAVAVVGDFNDWNLTATPLVREAGDGVWWVTVPLPPGRYRYAFVVDGTAWRGDPDAPAADEEFGRPSSVVNIGGA